MMFRLLLSRYLFSHDSRHRGRNIRILVGLVFSMLVLSTVLAVMDYMQEGRFEDLKRVRSFPVVIEGGEENYEELKSEFDSLAIVFAYRTGDGLLRTEKGTTPVEIRYIDDDYEGGVSHNGDVEDGILLPVSLFFDNNRKQSISLSRLEKGNKIRNTVREREYKVDGIYRTALGHSFDDMMVFMSLKDAPEDALWHLAFIPYALSEEKLAQILKERNCGRVVLWKDAEESLYGAMLLEKIVMTVLLSSLFLIVLVEIHRDAVIFASSRRRELGALYLMGTGRRRIVAVFASIGSLLALLGGLLGVLLSAVLLKILPNIMGGLFGAVLYLDVDSLAIILVLVVLVSTILYARAFGRVLRRDAVDAAIREV